MTKKEIVKSIALEIGMTKQKTKELVQKTFDTIIEALVTERRIELRNFGVFEVRRRASRLARNPQTGEPMEVESRLIVAFRPGKEMEARVRELEARERLLGKLDAEPGPPAEQVPAKSRRASGKKTIRPRDEEE